MTGETISANAGNVVGGSSEQSATTPAELAQALHQAIELTDQNAIDAIRRASIDKRVLGKDSDLAEWVGVEVTAEKALADLGDPRFKENF